MLPQVHVEQGPQGQRRVLVGGAGDLQPPGAAHQPHPSAAEHAHGSVLQAAVQPLHGAEAVLHLRQQLPGGLGGPGRGQGGKIQPVVIHAPAIAAHRLAQGPGQLAPVQQQPLQRPVLILGPGHQRPVEPVHIGGKERVVVQPHRRAPQVWLQSRRGIGQRRQDIGISHGRQFLSEKNSCFHGMPPLTNHAFWCKL